MSRQRLGFLDRVAGKIPGDLSTVRRRLGRLLGLNRTAAPHQPALHQVAPSQAARTQGVPAQTASPQAIPLQSVSPQAVPPQAVPPQAAPSQAAPSQAVPPQAVPPQAVPPQAVPPQAVPTRAVSPQGVSPQTAAPRVAPPQAIPPKRAGSRVRSTLGGRRPSSRQPAAIVAGVAAGLFVLATPIAIHQVVQSTSQAAEPQSGKPFAAKRPTTSASPTPKLGDGETPGTAPSYDPRLLMPSGAPLPRLHREPPGTPLKLDNSSPYAPVITRIPTRRKTVFITLDDGGVRPKVAKKLFADTGAPSTFFLIGDVIGRNPAYFKTLRGLGASLQSHTATHAKLGGMSPKRQHQEICGAVQTMKGMFGTSPTLFRPPFGSYDQTTLKVARECGINAVVMWQGSVINGSLYIDHKRFDPVTNPLQPGMILLMHFTPHFEHDYRTLVSSIIRSGYDVGRLEDYVS